MNPTDALTQAKRNLVMVEANLAAAQSTEVLAHRAREAAEKDVRIAKAALDTAMQEFVASL